MIKEQAIEAMKAGNKVTHIYFTDKEFIYMEGEKLFDESGLQLPKHDFWANKNNPAFNNNWAIFIQNTKENDN